MTHTLTLAKTSLLASLTRPDPSPLSRSDLDAFHSSLITATSARCSCLTVQTCKDWIVQNIAPSEKRTEALGNYVFALAGSFDGGQKKDGQKDGVSVRRRQLHLLYVLHDVLHHLNFHDRRDGDDETMRKWFCDAMQVPIEKILRLIALTFHRESTRNSRIRKRVYDLLEIWERDAYFPSTALTTYRDLITSPPPPPPTSTSQTDDTSSRTAKKQEKSLRDAPYILPATHGDPSTPYHELPAGNMLPHITPNSTHPIQPSSLKPLPCHAGPAKAELVTALKKFMGDVERLYAVGDAFTFSPPAIEGEEGHEEGETGVTELGEIVKKDALGDVIWGETYYGWSREFCTRMREEGKKRRAAAAAGTGAEIGEERGTADEGLVQDLDLGQRNRDRILPLIRDLLSQLIDLGMTTVTIEREKHDAAIVITIITTTITIGVKPPHLHYLALGLVHAHHLVTPTIIITPINRVLIHHRHHPHQLLLLSHHLLLSNISPSHLSPSLLNKDTYRPHHPIGPVLGLLHRLHHLQQQLVWA
ncbi:RNA polymerase II, large subunit, CTD [Ascosphaera apis ARSEF 7405]|uniref:RNA polymerase II, large subunit, CTD n=1 Tax=Ascosphaera apis ARSEF 7405 TaxID=392613 RepID=A0A167VAB4_9EURO|nr:RNA polymerase II, large subunit, CTD [Ascosphaera apis ARSEF 7405]